MRLKPPLITGLGALVIICALLLRTATGTPMYSARAGRTCDNCHLTPNRWVNPELAKRKCSLACQTCHVDPAGGGMRSASGRFYGRATLPMIATSPRPTVDWDREPPLTPRRIDRATTYTDDLPEGPATFEESHVYRDSTRDWWAHGSPRGGPDEYALFPGRYGSLKADPLFRFGWDIRLAALYSRTLLRFPMQADFPVSIHPVDHVTFLVNTGVRGRPSGYSDTFDDERTPYFREAFLMVHEAPYQTYLKGGRFVPSYGLRLDDHTSQIRRQFELDGALPETRVTGIEIGAAPNYPFINLSYFRMTSRARVPHAFDIFDVDDGWGTAVNLGYRNLAYAVGGSMLLRRRPLEEGGDTSTFGLYGVFNPAVYRPKMPLTYQAEFDAGSYQRASGVETNNRAFYQELDWLAFNGVNVLVAHDWADPDTEVRDDASHRIGAGAQFIPISGVTLEGRFRVLFPSAGRRDTDLFFQFHVWN